MTSFKAWFTCLVLLQVVSRSYQAAVAIDAYPSTQPVPLGTTVVLVCRVFGVPEESSSASYQWSCPNGACDISIGTRGPPRSRIVSGNTLTVNIIDKSDSGEYRCTVSEGGTTQTSSYKITVTGGIALYTVEARKPVRVFQSHSIITNPDDVKAGFFKVSISCVGDGSSAVGQWRQPDGSEISANFFASTYQRDGQLLISRLNRQYYNGNYKCKIGDEEAVIGLYFPSGSPSGTTGTYSGTISNFTATMISSSTTRLSWNTLTDPDPSTTTTVGYFVSYGRVDHGVKEKIMVKGRSNTNLDLSNLDSGVDHEATIRGFSEDGVDRRVSTPVASVRWRTTAKNCSGAGISNIKRTLKPDGRVEFDWTTRGCVNRTVCKLDDGWGTLCDGFVSYNVSTFYSGVHHLTVTPYCNFMPLRSKRHRFKSESGIPKDPSKCKRLIVQNVNNSFRGSSVSVEFTTNITADCSCRLVTETKKRTRRICASGATFRRIFPADLRGMPPPKVVVTCKSSEPKCDVVHKVSSHITMRVDG